MALPGSDEVRCWQAKEADGARTDWASAGMLAGRGGGRGADGVVLRGGRRGADGAAVRAGRRGGRGADGRGCRSDARMQAGRADGALTVLLCLESNGARTAVRGGRGGG
jgi:hypothetical protein